VRSVGSVTGKPIVSKSASTVSNLSCSRDEPLSDSIKKLSGFDVAVLTGDSWLPSLLSDMETCKFGFVLLSANDSERSFPVVGVTAAAEEYFGCRRAQMLGLSYESLFDFASCIASVSSSRVSCLHEFQDSITRGIGNVIEIPFMKSGQQVSSTVVALHPVSDESGRYRYMIIMFVCMKADIGSPNNLAGDFVVNDDMMRSFCAHFLCEISETLPRTVAVGNE
jgi:hypothetical protein